MLKQKNVYKKSWSKTRLLSLKLILIVVVVITVFLSLFFNKQILSFLSEKVNSANIEILNKTTQATSQEDSIKTIKSTCVSEVKEYIESDDDKFTAIKKQEMFDGTRWTTINEATLLYAEDNNYSTLKRDALLNYAEEQYTKQMEDFIWQINSKYRICLAENGLTPEDLLVSPNQLDSDTAENVSSPQNTTKNLFEEAEKDELERKQECQNKMNKYNICLSEYNSKISEYNLCMNNPKKLSWSCGFEPQNSCSKPIGCL